MADIDTAQWLEQWLEEHVGPAGRAERKADMREAATRCAHAAGEAGIAIAELKAAAGGDLETFLLERQRAAAAQARHGDAPGPAD